MQTSHGRSTPLLWKTVRRSALKDRRNDHEDEWLVLLSAVLDKGVRVTVVADCGFADSKRFVFLKEELGFEYLIRLRANVDVEAEWVGRDGRRRLLRNIRITAQRAEVPVFVCVQEAGMKDVWSLMSSRPYWICRKARIQRNHSGCAFLVRIGLKEVALQTRRTLYQLKHALLDNYPFSNLRIRLSK